MDNGCCGHLTRLQLVHICGMSMRINTPQLSNTRFKVRLLLNGWIYISNTGNTEDRKNSKSVSTYAN